MFFIPEGGDYIMNGRTNTTSVTEVIEGVQVPLEAPTNLVLTPLNARVDITWTDPVDKFAAPDGQTATNPWDNVATWDHTIVVRKANSAPTSPSDGELIYTETTRNQHQYTAYSDTNNVINNTVYYYAVYAITTMDAVSEPIIDSCKPIEGMPTYKQSLDNVRNDVNNSSEFDMVGMSLNGQALFAGGNYFNSPNYIPYSSIVRYDESFTRHEDINSDRADGRGVASISTYGMFAGGYNRSSTRDPYIRSTSVIDTSFTQVDTELELSSYCSGPAGVGFNNYIIFAGGLTNYSSGVNTVDSFNISMTKSTLTNLQYAVYDNGGTSTSTHAIFAGGRTYNGIRNNCRAYDNSLTSINATNLSSPSASLAAATIDDRAAFFNGYTTTNDDLSTTIDIYDTSLTKSSVNNIPKPTYPDGSYPYCPNQAYKFGSFIILQLRYDTAGPSYSAMYLFDSSLTLHGELSMPDQDGYCSKHAEIGNKYSLIPFYSDCIYVYEAV